MAELILGDLLSSVHRFIVIVLGSWVPVIATWGDLRKVREEEEEEEE